jgi:predicted nucleotidyltransferase
VVEAARRWAAQLKHDNPEIVRIGYFGSYARGDYVPGSDFDVLIEVTSCEAAKRRDRADPYRPDHFPVPLNLFVYTSDEIAQRRARHDAFLTALEGDWRGL